MKDYYKKIDKSFFHYGIRLQRGYIDSNTFTLPRDITLSLKKVILIFYIGGYDKWLRYSVINCFMDF